MIQPYTQTLSGKAERTQYLYKRSAENFLNWISPAEPSQELLDAYVSKLHKESKFTGYRTKLIHLSGFIHHLNENGYTLALPKIKKQESKPPKLVSPVQYGKIQASTKQPHHKLAWALMYQLGLRIGEVIRLRWVDIDVENGTISVLRKGGKWQVLPYKYGGESVDTELTKLIEAPEKRGEYLITSPRTNDVCSQQALWYALKRACKAAGVASISPHTFRHGFAHDKVKNGVSAQVLTHFLGHSNPATTQQYLRHIGGDVDVLRQALKPAG
jgi:integrase/recombinase XerD